MNYSFTDRPIKRCANRDLKQYARTRGVSLWMIAQRAGCCEMTITRLLRNELSPGNVEKFKKVIDEIAAEINQEAQ